MTVLTCTKSLSRLGHWKVFRNRYRLDRLTAFIPNMSRCSSFKLCKLKLGNWALAPSAEEKYAP
jgi:hypothetical protein